MSKNKPLYKFVRENNFKLFELIFGMKYHISVADEYGDQYSDPVPNEIEERIYVFMKERGFKVKWKGYRHSGYTIITVQGKAQEAQFKMIASGVLDIEPFKPQKVSVFKV